MSPFCGATDTTVLDFWWHLLWVSKPEWVLPYSSLVEVYMLHYTFCEIHLWCDTCWPLGGQHGSQAISSMYLRGIGGTRNRELSCRRSQCEIRIICNLTGACERWIWIHLVLVTPHSPLPYLVRNYMQNRELEKVKISIGRHNNRVFPKWMSLNSLNSVNHHKIQK